MNPRTLLVFGYDLVMAVLAWSGAFWLSYDFDMPREGWEIIGTTLIPIVVVQAILFFAFGLYRGLWRFASLPDLERILLATVFGGGAATTLLFLLQRLYQVPRAVLILDPLLLVALMSGGRIAYRMWKERRSFGANQFSGRPVLVLGAGRIAASLVAELTRSKEWRVVGILDDDPTMRRREIFGMPVLGPLAELRLWAGRLAAGHAIIATGLIETGSPQRMIDLCIEAGVKPYILPTTEQLLSGYDSAGQLRPVNLEDLLGRSPVRIDATEVKALLSDRVVMVTGAGGSIGSELCRQIARLNPAQLVIFENNEYALYCLNEEMAELFPELPVVPLAGDVKDSAWMGEIMRRYAPAVVFHAAAYKHVPLMEEQNAWQAVRNNVLGTYVVAMAALRAKVPEFVLVSTDKAVNPTNVMGASKRLSEMVCQALQEGQADTRFEIVRFGNVLGSTGSVIPKFQAQIERGGPVTVTHPEITRFFMSIPEASQLVLQAAAIGEGGEIFVLDMGQPVRIADLARDMIRLSGRREDEIRIVYTGLRPGEKLYEEPLSDSELTRPTHHPKLRIAKARTVPEGWLDELLDWLKEPKPKTDAEVRRDLRRWVNDYQPSKPPELRPVVITR